LPPCRFAPRPYNRSVSRAAELVAEASPLLWKKCSHRQSNWLAATQARISGMRCAGSALRIFSLRFVQVSNEGDAIMNINIDGSRPPAAGRKMKDDAVVAYLSYALKDVRGLSPLGAHLLEMSIAVLNDDIRLANEANDNTSKVAS
jgi:hypothetical protein